MKRVLPFKEEGPGDLAIRGHKMANFVGILNDNF